MDLKGLFEEWGERKLFLGQKRREGRTRIYPEEGSAAWQSLFLVEEGMVLISRTFVTQEGRERVQSLRIAGPGEIFGESVFWPENRGLIVAEALTASVKVREIKKEQLDLLVGRDLVLQRELYSELLKAEQVVIATLLSQATERVLIRVARFLLDLSERFGFLTPEGIEFNFALTHQDIADAVFASRETTTLALAKLQHIGCIRTRRFHITVTDREKLRALVFPN